MKKTILTAMCLAPLYLLAQKPFAIKGDAKSLKDGDKIYLVYVDKKERKTDSAIVNKGAFQINGAINGPTAANLFLNKNPYVNRPARGEFLDSKSLYIEPVSFQVKVTDSLKNAVVIGSKVNDENAKLIETLKPHSAKNALLMKEYGSFTSDQRKDAAFMKPFMDRYEALDKEKAPYIEQFIKANPDSYISLVSMRELMGPDLNPAVVEPIFERLSAARKSSEAGMEIKRVMDGVKKTQIGMSTDFSQNDPEGKLVKLSDFKGKYVLVDFWASWCVPCREENPNVVTAYNKFKDKNFTVLGVSLDGATTKTTKESWLKAIEADGLTWAHVSDLQGWQNAVSKDYGVQSIPFNFLVDPTGKIIARNLRGEKLQTTLAELLGSKSK